MRVERNAEKDGIKIFFDDKPDQAMRDRVKSNGFRFGKYKKCWYAKYTPERWEFAMSLTGEYLRPFDPAENKGIFASRAEVQAFLQSDITSASTDTEAIADKVDSAIAYLQQLLEEI